MFCWPVFPDMCLVLKGVSFNSTPFLYNFCLYPEEKQDQRKNLNLLGTEGEFECLHG